MCLARCWGCPGGCVGTYEDVVPPAAGDDVCWCWAPVQLSGTGRRRPPDHVLFSGAPLVPVNSGAHPRGWPSRGECLCWEEFGAEL